MSKHDTSPRTLIKRWLYEFATQDCADITISTDEAYDFAGSLGDFHEGYWAGYHDCAVALSATLARIAPKQVLAEVTFHAAADSASRPEDPGEESGVSEADHVRNGLGFWDGDSRFAQEVEQGRVHRGEDDGGVPLETGGPVGQ